MPAVLRKHLAAAHAPACAWQGAAASASCVLDGKIYIFGPDGLFSFDPATGAWETDLPLPVSHSLTLPLAPA